MSILNNSINSMNNTIGTNEISIDYFGLDSISIGVFTNDFGNTIFKYMCSNLFIWKIFQYNLMLIIYELEFKKNLIKIFSNVPPAVSKSSQTMPLANLATCEIRDLGGLIRQITL